MTSAASFGFWRRTLAATELSVDLLVPHGEASIDLAKLFDLAGPQRESLALVHEDPDRRSRRWR
jgi:hypothetical protein